MATGLYRRRVTGPLRIVPPAAYEPVTALGPCTAPPVVRVVYCLGVVEGVVAADRLYLGSVVAAHNHR